MNVTHEMILLSLVRFEHKMAIAEATATLAAGREAALVAELDQCRAAMRDMDAEIARLRDELEAIRSPAPCVDPLPPTAIEVQ